MINKEKHHNSFSEFFKHNVNGGMVLIVVAILAMVVANSYWSSYYVDFLDYPISLKFGDFNIFSHEGKPLTMAMFINDCLMAIFFFHVGLEVKREILVGELSSVRKASLPIVAAVGGMLVPVAIYLLFNRAAPYSSGAAIPMATDIAFSLGVLSLLGKRVPLGLKIFLTTFAVADDIGGILVIALFYTHELHFAYLLGALGLVAFLGVLSYLGVKRKRIYIITGIVVWYLILQSGIHSTIAGVLMAFTIPSKPRILIGKYIRQIKESAGAFSQGKYESESIILTENQIHELRNIQFVSKRVISPLQFMEDRLHGLVNYFILPLFAFSNAGIVLSAGGSLFSMVTFGVALGLIVGKPVGIFIASWLAVKLKFVSLPKSVSWHSIFGVACLGGIGFTVSLFITNLSFGSIHPELLNQAKLGIILGTIISGIVGYAVLRAFLPKEIAEE
jgi:NhaA family Na+:H+ antiporter